MLASLRKWHRSWGNNTQKTEWKKKTKRTGPAVIISPQVKRNRLALWLPLLKTVLLNEHQKELFCQVLRVWSRSITDQWQKVYHRFMSVWDRWPLYITQSLIVISSIYLAVCKFQRIMSYVILSDYQDCLMREADKVTGLRKVRLGISNIITCNWECKTPQPYEIIEQEKPSGTICSCLVPLSRMVTSQWW